MIQIGFPISTKEKEVRRALLPVHLKSVRKPQNLFFAAGYGEALGYSDRDYLNMGANVVSLDEVLSKQIVCDPKIGDAQYLEQMAPGQTIFGWVHAVQNREITDVIIGRQLTAIAWEDMFDAGRHVFWRNNELAGEAAILHAFTMFGKVPSDCKVALIGMGNVSRGAYRVLSALGADVSVYDRTMEALLRQELYTYDVVVNGVLWDVSRTDHIIGRTELSVMKKPSMIIDISCDRAGAIETSIPTTIEKPTYIVDGVLHYAVDHTPALVGYSASLCVGQAVVKYLNNLIEGRAKKDEVLKNATIIERGRIMDQRIIAFQNR